MKQMIRAVSMTAVLLGAAGAFAEDGQEARLDLRTEEEKVHDALQEAWDNAALEALEASTAVASDTLADESSEATSSKAEPVNEYTEAQAVELMRTSEPESIAWLAAPPVRMRGCWYFVTTPPQGRFGPPRYYLTVQRMASQHCEAQTVVLDSSYNGGATVAQKGSKGLAIAFPSKQSPSGSALVHVRLFAIHPTALTVPRTGFLGTYRGSTWVNSMHFEGNRLLVDTSRYTATYARFLTSEEAPTGVIFP
ncbi:hypothetical protein [Archangium sp.]|uniref:hypothetical protein n=1 Tax=Archangium sp. TaxID=1872627 RepID=UPI00286B43AF|nr:hypothetical protein [Archangium sp.]